MDDSEKLIDLLNKFFDRRAIEVDINEYNFDFEFTFDIRGIELSKLNRILTSLTELNKSVLIQYNTELELYERELTVFFDKKDDVEFDNNEEEEV